MLSVRRRAQAAAASLTLLALGVGMLLLQLGYALETAVLGVGWVMSIPLAIVVGLTFTAPFAAELAESRMTDPNGRVQELRRKDLEAFEERVKKALPAELLAMVAPTEAGKNPDGTPILLPAWKATLSTLNVTLDAEAIANMVEPGFRKAMASPEVATVLDQAIDRGLGSAKGKSMRTMVNNEAKGTEEDIALAKLAQDNPEAFGVLQQAIGWVQTVGPTLGWKDKEIEKKIKRWRELAIQGGNLKTMLEKQGIKLDGGPQNSGGGGGGGGGRTGSPW